MEATDKRSLFTKIVFDGGKLEPEQKEVKMSDFKSYLSEPQLNLFYKLTNQGKSINYAILLMLLC